MTNYQTMTCVVAAAVDLVERQLLLPLLLETVSWKNIVDTVTAARG